MKTQGKGQALTLTNAQIWKIHSHLKNPHFKAIWVTTCYTGLRINETRTLRCEDVYLPSEPCEDCYDERPWREPRRSLTVRKEATKGKRALREIPSHRELDNVLRANPIGKELCFPSCRQEGMLYASLERPYTRQAYDYALRHAAEECRLYGVSTHSGRRSFATRLYNEGVDLATIQSMTGHANLQDLSLYIHRGIDAREKAVDRL